MLNTLNIFKTLDEEIWGLHSDEDSSQGLLGCNTA